MIKIVSMWGTYPWFAECGVDLIHPDDLEAFKQEVNNSKVFECIIEEKTYMTISYNNKRYRVKSKLFQPVPVPKYNFGEMVKIRKNGEAAVITDIMWHYGGKKHYYFLAIGNKKKSRRYWEAELI